MGATSLSRDQARRIAVRAQRFGPPTTAEAERGDAKDAAAQTIDRLGYVQIDTIAVVERAHHHTLWTRSQGYEPQLLHDLQAVDRRVFEYWAHAIAVLPMTDYRFYLRRMERHRTSDRAWLSEWRTQHTDTLAHVLERIRREGALTSKDFEPPPGTKRGTWWDWKPAKRALEVLFWQGDLMISERRNFQKLYDLTERVLPPGVDVRRPSSDEMARHHVRRVLGAHGLAQVREIAASLRIATRPEIERAVAELERAGEIVPLRIEGLDEVHYAEPAILEAADRPPVDRAVLLSPFDNLIIQRDRVERLFEFSYTLECYLPAAKRKSGYFVFPILWRDRLIGRLDPKADRRSKTLLVRSLLFEPNFDRFDDALPALADALASFARFNGCRAVAFDRITPTGHKRRIKTLVRRALAA